MKKLILVVSLFMTCVSSQAADNPYTVSASPFVISYKSAGAFHPSKSFIDEGLLLNFTFPLDHRWRLILSGGSSMAGNFNLVTAGIGLNFFDSTFRNFNLEDSINVLQFQKLRPALNIFIGSALAQAHVAYGSYERDVVETSNCAVVEGVLGYAFSPTYEIRQSLMYFQAVNANVTTNGFGLMVGVQYNMF